jgi:hypothetical protein
MDVTNIAWVTFITSSALWWAITNGLISYYEQKQDEVAQIYFRAYVATLKFDQHDELLKAEFLKDLRLARLQLVPIPDVVGGLKVFRAQAIGLLGSSVSLLFTILIFRAMAEFGILQEAEMKRLGFWLSLFSIAITFIVAAWIVFTPILREFRHAFAEVSQWRNIRASTSEQ